MRKSKEPPYTIRMEMVNNQQVAVKVYEPQNVEVVRTAQQRGIGDFERNNNRINANKAKRRAAIKAYDKTQIHKRAKRKARKKARLLEKRQSKLIS